MDKLFFLEVRCSETKKPFFARFDYAADDTWALTYGVRNLPAGESVSSGSSQQDISNLRVGPQYRCPDCGSVDFVRCGACGKQTCYKGTGLFHCAYCGNSGEVKGTIDTIDVTNSGNGQ